MYKIRILSPKSFILTIIILNIWVLGILIISTGCKDRTAITIQGRVLIPSDSLYLPQDVAIVDEYLVIIDASMEAAQVYNRSDGKYVKTLGRHGKGPGEFAGVWSINKDYINPNAFWIFDFDLFRLTKWLVGSEFPEIIITLQKGMPYNPVVIGDSLVISPGFSLTEGRFAIYDTSGKLIREIGPVPEGGAAKVPVWIHLEAYQGTLKIKPDRSKLVMGTRYADQIEIYDPDGVLITKVSGPLNSIPIYEVHSVGDKPVMAINRDKTYFGYLDLDVTNDLIYALYSGRLPPKYPGRANFGEYIHIYDWNGNLVRIHKLDNDVIEIAVDESGEKLYALRHDPSPAILEYKISSNFEEQIATL